MASEVVKAVGGVSSINAAAHCATRLRLILADESKIDQAALDVVDNLRGTFVVGGMLQIIVDPDDADVIHQRVVSDHDVREVPKNEAKEEAEQGGNLFPRFIKMIVDIFVPVLPALTVGGLMMAPNNVLQAGFSDDKSIIDIYPTTADYASLINLVSAAVLALLLTLAGFSATKRSGGNIYLGAVMGAVTVSGSLLSVYSMTDQDAADAF